MFRAAFCDTRDVLFESSDNTNLDKTRHRTGRYYYQVCILYIFLSVLLDHPLKDMILGHGGGVRFVSALRLGHRWWCRIGQCIAARISVVV